MKCPNYGGHRAKFKASRTESPNQKKSLVRKRKKLPRKKVSMHTNHSKRIVSHERISPKCPNCGFKFDARDYV